MAAPTGRELLAMDRAGVVDLYEGMRGRSREDPDDRAYFDTVSRDVAGIVRADTKRQAGPRWASRLCLLASVLCAVYLMVSSAPYPIGSADPFAAAGIAVSRVVEHASESVDGAVALVGTVCLLAAGLGLRALVTARDDLLRMRLTVLLYGNGCPVREVKGMKVRVKDGTGSEGLLMWDPRAHGGIRP